jgi:hypothetical protein
MRVITLRPHLPLFGSLLAVDPFLDLRPATYWMVLRRNLLHRAGANTFTTACVVYDTPPTDWEESR